MAIPLSNPANGCLGRGPPGCSGHIARPEFSGEIQVRRCRKNALEQPVLGCTRKTGRNIIREQ